MKYVKKEVLKLVQDSLQKIILEKVLTKRHNFWLIVTNLTVSNRVYLSIPKNITCKDAFNIKEELQSFKNEPFEEFNRFNQALFAEIN